MVFNAIDSPDIFRHHKNHSTFTGKFRGVRHCILNLKDSVAIEI